LSTDLAERVRTKEGGVSTQELHSDTAWPLRRFNPALARMIREIDRRHVGKTGDMTYPTRHFHVDANDRVSLCRFIERHQPRRS
jgi:hypothetical protein